VPRVPLPLMDKVHELVLIEFQLRMEVCPLVRNSGVAVRLVMTGALGSTGLMGLTDLAETLVPFPHETRQSNPTSVTKLRPERVRIWIVWILDISAPSNNRNF
jgi:hypothetical protein